MDLRSRAELRVLRDHLNDLSAVAKLSQDREWWPHHLFHCTDIRNVVNILTAGELLSRTQARRSSKLLVDIAAPEIIGQTDAKWQDYVRLYFRPRTPTQFSNEGFRPRAQWQYDAHCPVPVYIVFDAFKVLARTDSLFTDGNVAAGAKPSDAIAALKAIPFNLVYHDSWFEPPERAEIVYHRSAEVLVPRRLDLKAIRAISCRSQAEYETLMYLLPPGARARWASKIGVHPNRRLFYSRWTFVQQVEMNDEYVLVWCNPDTATPGPFAISVEVSEQFTYGPKKLIWSSCNFQADRRLRLRLSKLKHPQDYSVRLTLDGQLGFAGRYQEDELMF